MKRTNLIFYYFLLVIVVSLLLFLSISIFCASDFTTTSPPNSTTTLTCGTLAIGCQEAPLFLVKRSSSAPFQEGEYRITLECDNEKFKFEFQYSYSNADVSSRYLYYKSINNSWEESILIGGSLRNDRIEIEYPSTLYPIEEVSVFHSITLTIELENTIIFNHDYNPTLHLFAPNGKGCDPECYYPETIEIEIF